MTPEEKAKELVDKFSEYVDYSDHDNYDPAWVDSIGLQNKKQCALTCIDEIIAACEYNHVESWNTDWWNEVKEEINKL